jgi:hypothetical protein
MTDEWIIFASVDISLNGNHLRNSSAFSDTAKGGPAAPLGQRRLALIPLTVYR